MTLTQPTGVTTLDTSGTQVLGAGPEETLLRPNPSDTGLSLITADSAAPAGRTPQILHTNGPVEPLLLRSFISWASTICLALNVLNFQVPT